MKEEFKKRILEVIKGLDINTVDGEFRAVDLLTQQNLAESRSMARKILWSVRKDPLEPPSDTE